MWSHSGDAPSHRGAGDGSNGGESNLRIKSTLEDVSSDGNPDEGELGMVGEVVSRQSSGLVAHRRETELVERVGDEVQREGTSYSQREGL